MILSATSVNIDNRSFFFTFFSVIFRSCLGTNLSNQLYDPISWGLFYSPSVNRSFALIVLRSKWIVFPSAKRFRCPHVTFFEMERLSSCASEDMIVISSSPFRGKLIQAHDEPRLNPKTAWIHYRWVQTGTRLRIQAKNERLFRKKEEALDVSIPLHFYSLSAAIRDISKPLLLSVPVP